MVVVTLPINFPSTGEKDDNISPSEKKLLPVEVPLFISLTPNFINDWINQILGTSDVSSPQKSFASTVGEFEPTRAPERTEFESVETRDPIIESIYNKLDNL